MIGRVYQLVDTKRIEMKEREILLSNDTVLVRPEFMSICAADQRYYLGKRKREILNKKLPMALIHEATGTVIRDFSGNLKSGAKVVLIPLDINQKLESEIKGNYRADSKFASSGSDGFMRDIVAIKCDRLLSIDSNYSNIYVFAEVLSIALGAISIFEKTRHTSVGSFGVWGDGSIGFVTALALRCKYPQSNIYVFGKSARKLSKFSFATAKFYIDNLPDHLSVNHAFECVGGQKSEDAIQQIIERISPQGTINLLGVSEEAVGINTRSLLDKGLQFLGHSRSDRNDFTEAVKLISENIICTKYIKLLISETIHIKCEEDITRWFEQDVLNDFKTLGVWQI